MDSRKIHVMGDSPLNGQKGLWDQTVAGLAGHPGEPGLYINGMGRLLRASTDHKCFHMYLNLTATWNKSIRCSYSHCRDEGNGTLRRSEAGGQTL